MSASTSLRTIVLSSILLLTIAFTFSGCRKSPWPPPHHPGSNARIARFSYGPGSDSMSFTYNAAGNPLSGVRPFPATGAPDLVFRYDASEHLTDLIGSYSTDPITDNSNIEVWHRYIYDGLNNIVVDSVYIFPEVSGGRPIRGAHGVLTLYTFTYDPQHRIISSIRDFGQGPEPPVTYAYDNAGNLIGTAHDQKTNFRQTNKLWLFFDRDYSVNNPLPATYTYNAAGLPTHIVEPPGSFGNFFYTGESGLQYTEADIRYF